MNYHFFKNFEFVNIVTKVFNSLFEIKKTEKKGNFFNEDKKEYLMERLGSFISQILLFK